MYFTVDMLSYQAQGDIMQRRQLHDENRKYKMLERQVLTFFRNLFNRNLC